MLNEYVENQDWIRIINILNKSVKNNTQLSFEMIDDFVYRKKISDDASSFVFKRMCVSISMINDILTMVHNDEKHFGFERIYERIVCFWYIRELISHLKRFLKNYSECNVNRTRRHKPFDSLQSILFSSISFHILTIDFVLALSESHTNLNVFMSITCKFSKRIIAISEKNIWKIFDWATIMLERLNLTDWDLLKVIISNRDRKFLSDLWITLFNQLKVKLLYSTVYHSQIDDASERTNQTLKIALRYHLMSLKNSKDWLTIIDFMQRDFNNISFSIIIKTSNEICYDFTSCTSIDLINFSDITSSRALIRRAVENSIAFSQVMFKHYYDREHNSHQFEVNDWVLLKLHKNYKISSTKILDKKLSQQYVNFFKIIEKIDNLIYRLKISKHWRIHSVISIAQLKLFESSFTINQSSSVFMKEDSDVIKSFEVEKIISKRIIKKRDVKYFVRWLEYESEKNVWKNFSKLQNIMNFVDEYELTNSSNTHSAQLSLSQKRKRGRLKKF